MLVATRAYPEVNATLALQVKDVASIAIEPSAYTPLAASDLVYLNQANGVVKLRSADGALLGDNSMLILGDGASQRRWDTFRFEGAVGEHAVQIAAESVAAIRTLTFTTVAQTESATLTHEPSLSTASTYALCAHAMAGASEVVTKWKFVAAGRRIENNNCMSLPVGAGTVHVTATAEDGRVIEQDVVTQ